MEHLSNSSFQLAETFLRTNGRALDQRLFDFHFGSGSADDVLDALSAYANEDGGFGHGLEPDIQMPESSARTTTFGLQVAREVDAPADHPVMRSTIRYLIDTFDRTNDVWPIVPAAVDDAPHAPWWDYAGTEKGFNGFGLNPTAEALAFLYAFGDGSADDLIERLTRVVLDRVEASPDAMEMHDLQCCIRLADTATLPEDVRDRLVKKLSAAAEAEVTRNPERWGKYTLKPLGVVFTPTSCLATMFEEDVEANIAYEIDQQGEDGAWSPAWTWGDRYPEAWPEARRAWQSYITISTLAQLKAFGRIEQ